MEKSEIEAELALVRESIETMIERRPPEGFDAFDEDLYEKLVARETILLDLLRSENL